MGLSRELALELAETWETMAEMERASSADRRATLRECADAVRMLATRSIPHPAKSDSSTGGDRG